MEESLFIIAVAACILAVLAYRAWRSAALRAETYRLDILAAALWVRRGIQEQNHKSHAAANECFRKALDGLTDRLAIDAARRRSKLRRIVEAAQNIKALRGEIANPNPSRL